MISNRWSDSDAEEFRAAAGDNPADRELALRVYSSRLIGQDPDLVMHGGGNTSVKLTRKDIFGNDIKVLHVKGSGWALDIIDAAGLPGVRLDPLLQLRSLDRLSDEDMVNIQRCNLLDSTSSNPSIETLLHAFLPHTYVDHTHSTAFLALANLPDAEAAMHEIFGDRMAFVPYIMPGFDLAKLAADIYDKNPAVEGLLLVHHGHFAFGDSAKASYEKIIEHSNRVESWLRDTLASAALTRPAISAAADILPLLRGKIGAASAAHSADRDVAMPVMDLRTGDAITGFLARPDITALAQRGVATPDHVIRTKRFPLHLTKDILAGGDDAIAGAVDDFVADYKAYFDRNRDRSAAAKTMITPTPGLVWIAGLGIVGIGADAKAAAIAADLGQQTLAVMTMGEASGGFRPLGEAALFEMEYWSLEQAKLGRKTPPALTGRVVLITGGAGAIGRATANAFAAMGANIFLVDRDQPVLEQTRSGLGAGHGGVALDITAAGAAENAVAECVNRFGGLDILISNAGAAWTGNMATVDDAVLRRSFELNFFFSRIRPLPKPPPPYLRRRAAVARSCSMFPNRR